MVGSGATLVLAPVPRSLVLASELWSATASGDEIGSLLSCARSGAGAGAAACSIVVGHACPTLGGVTSKAQSHAAQRAARRGEEVAAVTFVRGISRPVLRGVGQASPRCRLPATRCWGENAADRPRSS